MCILKRIKLRMRTDIFFFWLDAFEVFQLISMRIVGDYLSYHNLYDECYEDGLFCCYFMIVFCWSIEYQISNMKCIGRDE